MEHTCDAPERKSDGLTERLACETMVDAAIEELKQVVTIQHELLCHLLDENYPVPLNLAEALEDAANRLLDFSESISRRNLAIRPAAWRED
jgi:hypothetical protein